MKASPACCARSLPCHGGPSPPSPSPAKPRPRRAKAAVMNSQNNREGIFAALNFLIVTILSLIISWVSSEKGGTPVSYWLAVGFVVLLATGALLQLARRSTDKPTPTPPPPDGTTPAPSPASSLPRAAAFVSMGALFGLIVSALFYIGIGPGNQG